MMSSSDLPGCPACGSRTVRAVHKLAEDGREILDTFYACSQCGTDRTQSWRDAQPGAFDQEAKERHAEEDLER